MKTKSERTRVVSARDIKQAFKEAFMAGIAYERKREFEAISTLLDDHAFEAWLNEVSTDG